MSTARVEQIDEVLTSEEASRYLKISSQTLRKLREQHLIYGKRVGRQWRYLKSELDQYLRTDDTPVAD